jgi:hypothetical protein
MRFYVCVIICSVLLYGCNKAEKPDSFWVGDYDWMYSIDSEGNIIDLSASADHFGFTIRRSGKVILYKNGKRGETGEMLSSYDPDQLNYGDVSDNICQDEFGEIYINKYPFNGYRNYFKKLQK